MKDLERHQKIYQSIFESENGKYILDDLKSILCVNSDILCNNDAYKEGLRIAYRYIEEQLSTKNK